MNDPRLNRRAVLSGALSAGAALCGRRAAGAPRPQFAAEREEDAILVKAATGKAVLRYVRRAAPGGKPPGGNAACYTHPIYTPTGELVTDLAPPDHPYLRGVFCGWADLRGDKAGDWWSAGAKSPRDARLVVNRAATFTETGRSTVLRLVNSWRADGASVLEEVLTLTVSSAPASYVLDYDYQLTPPTGTPVVIGQHPFGGFCYRAMPGGSLVITSPSGVADLPDSVPIKPQTNWPAARWYDMTYTTSDGTVSGLALIDHPKNPRTSWHNARSLHLMNPCIVADAPLSITSGTPLRLRYRLVPHDGPAQASEIGKLADSFSH